LKELRPIIHTFNRKKKKFTIIIITARSRALLEKLTGFKLVTKFSAFYETRSFITRFTSAHHLSLSSAIIIIIIIIIIIYSIALLSIHQVGHLSQNAVGVRLSQGKGITVLLTCTVLSMYVIHAMLANLTNSKKIFCFYGHFQLIQNVYILQTVLCSIFDTQVNVHELEHCRGT
jgi:hypothetical protein